MWYWIRNTCLALFLVAAAYVLITRPDFLLNPSANPAAEGFSQFYSNIRSALNSSSDNAGEHRLTQPDTSANLPQQLQQRAATVPPAPSNWRGTVTNRHFREGDTLRTRLGQYARDEGIELFWTLPQDYVVKYYFQTEDTLIAAVYDISRAISADFPAPVLSYYCPQERAAVITDKASDYLQTHCIPANVRPRAENH